jgi:hypothetical protein
MTFLSGFKAEADTPNRYCDVLNDINVALGVALVHLAQRPFISSAALVA